jgi:hypothetical protein
MASPVAVLVLAPMQVGTPTDFTSSTVSIWLQVSFANTAGGYYESGGIPSGVQAYASALGINVNQFLQAQIISEEDNDSNGLQYTYKYIPTTDSILILGPNGELPPSYAIPSSVIADVVVAKFTYNRL